MFSAEVELLHKDRNFSRTTVSAFNPAAWLLQIYTMEKAEMKELC